MSDDEIRKPELSSKVVSLMRRLKKAHLSESYLVTSERDRWT